MSKTTDKVIEEMNRLREKEHDEACIDYNTDKECPECICNKEDNIKEVCKMIDELKLESLTDGEKFCYKAGEKNGWNEALQKAKKDLCLNQRLCGNPNYFKDNKNWNCRNCQKLEALRRK